jgi:hypothetical protein
MYPVSSAFLQAVQENTRKYYWTGKITTKNGVVYNFDAEDIVKGSGYISSQCCGSTEIELGTVYSAELGITLLSDIDRYTLEDALVELTYHLRISHSRDSADLDEDYDQTVESDGIYEAIPMGVFEVSEANRTVKCLELKAYDYMLRFEKDFNGFETVGKAYDFIHLCCEACHVECAHTQAEIEAMPNGNEGLSIYTDNDIETYRDVLYYVGQVLGGFFCINREGQLELRKYGNTSVMTVAGRHRFSSSFSDFITRYTAVSSTNMRTEIAEYYHLDPDDGLTMNLGVNPLLQFGLEETRRELCENILADISVIDYVPFDSDTIGNPALDIGDVLTFVGGQADENQISAITSNQVKIYGKQTLKGVGKNPRLAQAKSKNDKNISGLLSQIEAGKIGIHTFTNASAFTIHDQDTKIISIEFATSEDNHAQFFGQVIVDVDADSVTRTATASGNVTIPAVNVDAISQGLDNEGEGENAEEEPEVIGTTEEQTVSVSLPVSWTEDGHADVIFSFEFNNQMIPIHYPQEHWCSGRHTILLYYPIENVMANYTNTFNVYMRCTGGSATVDTGFCIASISGQSMGADAAWDGKIEVEEYVERFPIGTGNLAGRLRGVGFTESTLWEIDELVKRSYSDTKSGRSSIGGFAVQVDVSGSNS